MFAPNASRLRMGPRHALAGLEAGITGVLVMLAVLMAGSVVGRRSVWLVPNLFATTFFGSDAYVNHFSRHTFAGLAILFALYGALGIAWGCSWRDNTRQRLTFFGGVFGLTIYFILFHFVWRRVNPLITLYAPDRQLELGHVLWGMMLARSPRYAREISRRLADAADQNPVYQQGEVIR